MLPLRWFVRRLLLALLVVFGAANAVFFAFRLLPGDPVRSVLGSTNPTPELVEQVRHDLALDEPLAVQYARFMGRLVTGDLGESFQLQQPVGEVIGDQILATAELALAAFVLALLVATTLAVLTAHRPRARRIASSLEVIAASTPAFWTGMLLLALFSFRLRWFPAMGGSGAVGLVLPAVTLAAGLVGVLSQVLREELERALEQPFVLTARARGSGETAIRFRHALRHGLIPLVTLAGWAVGALFGGAVVVESVFSRQGLGQVTAIAVAGRDLPVVTGVVLVSAVAFALINLAVDVVYRLVDPRIDERSIG
ncbi:ABC transporter permease [Streptomyces sp. DR3-1]|uniref:ABC transporter permease n=1 Tax=Streptomyces sp. DR3-1 TaxID=2951169 RepID=UPI00204338B9|nr:ABC transporter permease [Streptomyces sp. DR3-1]MCM3822386.1 ABC transporter permease [Streptomyces sp. DR3-1]